MSPIVKPCRGTHVSVLMASVFFLNQWMDAVFFSTDWTLSWQFFPKQGCLGWESTSSRHHEIPLTPVSSDWPAWNLVWRGQRNTNPELRNAWFLTNVPLDMWACRIHHHAIQLCPRWDFSFPCKTKFFRCRLNAVSGRGGRGGFSLLVCAGCSASLARTSTWSCWARSRPGRSGRAASTRGRSAPMRSDTAPFTWGLFKNRLPVRVEDALTASCAAGGVGGSLPDHGHAHFSYHQEGQRPAVPPGAVHHLQSDGRLPKARCTGSFCFQGPGLTINLHGCDETREPAWKERFTF